MSWSFLLSTVKDCKCFCLATARTVSASEELYSLWNPGVFFWVKDWTALEKPGQDFCRDSNDALTLWHIANSSKPMKWLFGPSISTFLLVPVVYRHMFPAAVTPVDGSGSLERESFPVLSQFLPSGAQPNRAVGDSWTKKVTGLPQSWNTVKTLVLWSHFIHLFLLYSLNRLLICVYVSFHDFAHIHPLMQHGCWTVQIITSEIQDYSISIWKPFTWLSCLECLAAN